MAVKSVINWIWILKPPTCLPWATTFSINFQFRIVWWKSTIVTGWNWHPIGSASIKEKRFFFHKSKLHQLVLRFSPLTCTHRISISRGCPNWFDGGLHSTLQKRNLPFIGRPAKSTNSSPIWILSATMLMQWIASSNRIVSTLLCTVKLLIRMHLQWRSIF